MPVEAVNEMRANFAIPELDDGFTNLEWPELPESDARAMINEIRSGGSIWKRRNPGAGKGSQPRREDPINDINNSNKIDDVGKQFVEQNKLFVEAMAAAILRMHGHGGSTP